MLGELAFGPDVQVQVKDTIAPTAFTATIGAITPNSVELVLQAADNLGSVNYTVSYGSGPVTINVTGTSATQKSCVVSGLNPGTNYTFTVSVRDAAFNQATNSPIAVVATTTTPVTPPATLIITSSPAVLSPYAISFLTDGNTSTSWKVLSPSVSYITFEYPTARIFNSVTLTSSTDNASRDPKSWAVKASNDTLTGWVILSSQANQSFATRELAKTYSFVNPVAYRFYRLHILESNYSTTSTMLGELAFGSDMPVSLTNSIQAALSDSLGGRIEAPSGNEIPAIHSIKVYSSARTLFIQNLSGNTGDITLYNIYGQMLLKHSVESNSTKSLPLNLPSGVYLVVGVAGNEKTIQSILLP